MRARDVHAEVEGMLGMSVPVSSVKTGWPSRFRINSSKSCVWDVGGIGWPNVLLVPQAWRLLPVVGNGLGGAAHCGRLGMHPFEDGWLAVAMQKLRRGIEAIGPHHRSCLVIDSDLPEVLGIAQRLPKRPVQQEGTVDVALNAVVERDPQAIAV
jgi:hypothetical protein